MKYGTPNTQILCRNKKVELIHNMLLNESRRYTQAELETICKKNGISIDKIIRQIISNGTDTYNQFYKIRQHFYELLIMKIFFYKNNDIIQ